jgi:hypothetical protein
MGLAVFFTFWIPVCFENWTFLKLYTFDPQSFWKELLFSQERDKQPTVKFDIKDNVMHIYLMIPRNKHFHVVCICESKKKAPQKRLIGVVSKKRVHSRKPNFLGISR